MFQRKCYTYYACMYEYDAVFLANLTFLCYIYIVKLNMYCCASCSNVNINV
jgi:hypothetical protein